MKLEMSVSYFILVKWYKCKRVKDQKGKKGNYNNKRFGRLEGEINDGLVDGLSKYKYCFLMFFLECDLGDFIYLGM